jgi:hypothetical protein
VKGNKRGETTSASMCERGRERLRPGLLLLATWVFPSILAFSEHFQIIASRKPLARSLHDNHVDVIAPLTTSHDNMPSGNAKR